MDYSKTGSLISSLRKEKNMTQKALADAMNLSDRTISKWERGIGCPDVSLLHRLSDILGVNIEKILSGSLAANDCNGGNMKNLKFYVCPSCGNILFSFNEAEISCCGRKLASLKPTNADETHLMAIEEIDNEYYATLNHDMSKSHYISFVAAVYYDRVTLIKLYPEQAAELHFPKMRYSKLYAYCNEHGLIAQAK